MADSRTVVAADVERALAALGAEVAEGTVGAGTGMSCFGFPGGIGTASRAVGEHHVGVLLLCNFGDREYLDLLGPTLSPLAPTSGPTRLLHRRLRDRRAARRALQLRRLALRPLLGLARAGSYGARRLGRDRHRLLDGERRRPGQRRGSTALRRRLRGRPRGRHELPRRRAARQRLDGTDAGGVPRSRRAALRPRGERRAARTRPSELSATWSASTPPTRPGTRPRRRSCSPHTCARPASSSRARRPRPAAPQPDRPRAGAGEGPSLMLLAPHRRGPGARRRAGPCRRSRGGPRRRD